MTVSRTGAPVHLTADDEKVEIDVSQIAIIALLILVTLLLLSYVLFIRLRYLRRRICPECKLRVESTGRSGGSERIEGFWQRIWHGECWTQREKRLGKYTDLGIKEKIRAKKAGRGVQRQRSVGRGIWAGEGAVEADVEKGAAPTGDSGPLAVSSGRAGMGKGVVGHKEHFKKDPERAVPTPLLYSDPYAPPLRSSAARLTVPRVSSPLASPESSSTNLVIPSHATSTTGPGAPLNRPTPGTGQHHLPVPWPPHPPSAPPVPPLPRHTPSGEGPIIFFPGPPAQQRAAARSPAPRETLPTIRERNPSPPILPPDLLVSVLPEKEGSAGSSAAVSRPDVQIASRASSRVQSLEEALQMEGKVADGSGPFSNPLDIQVLPSRLDSKLGVAM